MKTKAYAGHSADTPLEEITLERRELTDLDVEIDVLFCGVCHSDIHTVRGEWGPVTYPLVPGHEIVGTVTRTGDKVTKHKVGDTVGVGCLVNSCRTCDSCRAGLEQYCKNGATGTYDGVDPIDGRPTAGGYSQIQVVQEDFVLKIPAGMPLDQAAPAAVRRHHHLLASAPLEGGTGHQSGRYWPGRSGPHGGQVRPLDGRRSARAHHQPRQSR